MSNSTLHRVNKTILVAPYEGPIAAALVSEARAAGWRVAIATVAGGAGADPSAAPAGTAASVDAAPQGAAPPDVAAFPLTPGSYISSTTLFMSVRNALGDPDVVAIVSGGVAGGAARGADLVGGRPGEAEAAIQRETLGPAMLVREALRGFGARKAGRLVLLGAESEGEALGPAAALAAGAFRGLGDGVFVASREAPWEAFGILDKGENPVEAARFVLRLLEDGRGGKSGRWLRFTGQPGLFGVF
jgi:hypothetical protein